MVVLLALVQIYLGQDDENARGSLKRTQDDKTHDAALPDQELIHEKQGGDLIERMKASGCQEQREPGENSDKNVCASQQ